MAKVRLRLRAVLAGARKAPAPALILLALIGWWLFIGSHSGDHGAHAVGQADAQTLVPSSGHGAHAEHGGHGSTLSVASMLPGLGMWLAMILAMSPPMLIREVRILWRTSLRRNRATRALLFLFGYGLIWAIAGIVAVPLSSAIAESIPFICVTVIAVLVWQFSPLRQRLLRRCHRAPVLRAFGIDASRESLRYGLGSGVLCVAMCGPAMVLVLLTGQFHVVAMAVATILLTTERYLPIRRGGRSLLTRVWRGAPAPRNISYAYR